MMGLGMGELGIILVIALVIFGGKKLRNLGGDLGGAISEFKTSLNDDSDEDESSDNESEKKTEPIVDKAEPEPEKSEEPVKEEAAK